MFLLSFHNNISCVKTDSDTKCFIYVHNRFCSWCLISNIPQVMNWRDRTRMIPLLAFLKPGLDRVYQIDAVENLTYSFRAQQDKFSIIWWRWIDFIRLQREDLTWDIRLDYHLLPVDVICCIVYLFIYLFIILFSHSQFGVHGLVPVIMSELWLMNNSNGGTCLLMTLSLIFTNVHVEDEPMELHLISLVFWVTM